MVGNFGKNNPTKLFFWKFWRSFSLASSLQSTVVDRVYKKRLAEDTITNITLGSALGCAIKDLLGLWANL